MNNFYITTDIYLASALASLDYTLEIITQENHKFLFHFIKPNNKYPPLDVEVNNYWQGNLLLDPKRLFSEFKEIKTRMYDLKRSKNG